MSVDRLTDLPDWIMTKIKPAPDGCWLWTGAVREGYGAFKDPVTKRTKVAHRGVYELLVGPITEKTLDHLCRVRSCVNPDHLEPVSYQENILRGEGASAVNARKTHCVQGHPCRRREKHRIDHSPKTWFCP